MWVRMTPGGEVRSSAGVGLAVLMAVMTGGCAAPGGAKAGSTGTLPTPVTPPVPAGWKTVLHNRFAIDVPADWQVMNWQQSCGVQTPTVYLGPEGQRFGYRCTMVANGAEVDIGAFAYQGSQRAVITHINGLQVDEVVTHSFVAGPPSGTVTEMWLHVLSPVGGLSFFLAVGESTALPGGGPGMAAKIVSTIHLDVSGSG